MGTDNPWTARLRGDLSGMRVEYTRQEADLVIVIEGDGTGVMREVGGPLLTEPPRAGPRVERAAWVQSWPLAIPPALHAELLLALADADFPNRSDNLQRGEAPATIAVTAPDGAYAGMIVGSRLRERVPGVGAALAEIEALAVPVRMSIPPVSIRNPDLARPDEAPPDAKKDPPR